jgi:GAF domain-containing protein
MNESPTVQQLVDELLRSTSAGRVTLRLEDEAGQLPVIAEAVSGGVNRIQNEPLIDIRSAATVKVLEATGEALVQDDLLNTDVVPPQELLEMYRARAQMLAPIIANERLVGILSVHHVQGPRKWTPHDIAALNATVKTIINTLSGIASD